MFTKRYFAKRYFPPRYFPYYSGGAPPSEDSTYVEVFDIGTIISGALVTISWATIQFDDDYAVAIDCDLESSEDGVTYDTPVSGPSAFFPSVRYIRVTLTFTASNRHAVVAISNLMCNVDIKYALDSGNIYADEDDVGGTIVNFNKSFKDINSITVTVASTTAITAVYDFVDVPNPTHFHVYVFDKDGVRTSYDVSWKARGVI